jgi:hypothetical protein
MIMLDKNSALWRYLSQGQQGLIEEGMYLLEDQKQHPDMRITDYSYLVFPFAKAYEGFLKQLFLDLHLISEQEYFGDRFRIGKALNPHMRRILGKNAIYEKLERISFDKELAFTLWDLWKVGRNQVFHYFPHNLKALRYEEACQVIESMIAVMNKAVVLCKVKE